MALSDNEIEKVNILYGQLDVMTGKYNRALEDIHKLNTKIVEYADALVEKCKCTNHNTNK
jgi:hypothetical protein